MEIEIANVKGFKDYLPPESLKRKQVEKVIEKYFKLYGFLPVETPIIEFDELMKSDTLPSESEDEAVSDRFRLKDRAGRNLGLRYEFTFQLSRILKQNPNLKFPFRRYQIGPVFRDEPVSSERFRQFVQCDADIIGSDSVKFDAECILLFSEILEELGINAEVQINNRNLLKSIIESVQISNVKSVMKELDKMNKVGEDAVKLNLKKYADSNQILTLFKLLEKPLEFFKKNLFEGYDDLVSLKKECSKYGLKVKVNLFMIRGLGYYTGNIFEIVSPGKSSIAGGGRYDKSVGKYLGRDIPAVGISFGLERVTQLAKIDVPSQPVVIVISISQEKASIDLIKKIRKSGISCVAGFDKVGKSLEYADSYKIPYAVIIGDNEVSKGKYKLKDMKSGEESLVSEKQLIKKLF